MPQPRLLSKAWASDGLKNSIPNTRNSEMPQEGATYADGFPSITMTPISTGGKPPSGKDMNGVLYEISAHTVWQNQGGRYRFDQAFCDAIGGYSKGAVLINDTLDTEYISLVDANTHNPNSGNNTGKWEIHAGKGLKASTEKAGIVQLSSATNSTDESKAATPKAVKDAYDKAVAAEEAADGAVKTTDNQEIGGDKTFTGLTTLKKGAIVADSVGDFNANQYLQIGSNNVNSYLHNKKSGKYLSMRNDGELRYDGKRLLNVDDLDGMIPSGAVLYFAGQTAPTGWLKANGAAVSRTAYAALFAAIGTTYGAGDGRTTFNLPDLRGEFIRGWDEGRSVDAGRVFGSMQGDAIRNITGQFVSDDYNRSLVNEMLGAFAMTKRNSSLSYDAASSISTGGEYLNAIKFDASRVVPTAAENRPRNIALLACIKI